MAALAVLAAQVRRGDEVLKTSAEIGMIAALPTTCSSAVKLNALGERRSGTLDGTEFSAIIGARRRSSRHRVQETNCTLVHLARGPE